MKWLIAQGAYDLTGKMIRKQANIQQASSSIISTQYVKPCFKHSKELHKYIYLSILLSIIYLFCIIYLFHRPPVKAPILLKSCSSRPGMEKPLL